MSQKITSGAWSLTLDKASKPSSARTTSYPPCLRNISALRRMVLLSSTSRSFSAPPSAGPSTACTTACLQTASQAASRSNPYRTLNHIGSKLHHLEVFLACTTFRTDPVHGNVLPARASGDALFRQAGSLIVNPAADQAHPGTKFVHVDLNQLEYNGLIVAIGLSRKPKGLWASRPYLSPKPP